MKNFYVLLAAALVALPSVGSRPFSKAELSKRLTSKRVSVINRHKSLDKVSAVKSRGIKKLNTRADVAPLWKPTTEILSEWDSEWLPVEMHKYTYTPSGKVSVETVTSMMEDDEICLRSTSTYNEYDMPVKVFEELGLNEETLEPSSRQDLAYDLRVHDFITLNETFNFSDADNDWKMIGNYHRDVTRDDAGNVTKVVHSTLFEGEFDPTEILTITYKDGVAISVEQTILTWNDDYTELVWVPGEAYYDIVWENTDGQIVSLNDYLSMGANRIKSARYVSDGEEVGIVNQEYPDDMGSYIATVKEGTDIMIQKYTVLDNFGSYKEELILQEVGDPYTISSLDCIKYDAYGNVLYTYYLEDYDGEKELYEAGRGLVTYDEEHGYPTEFIFQEAYLEWMNGDYEDDWDLESVKSTATAEDDSDLPEDLQGLEWDNVYRSQMSDYINAGSAIDCIKVDGTAETPVYYDLCGRKVTNPSNGIFIRRQGTKTDKVIL